MRLRPGAFTRDRHLTLLQIAAMMISGMCASLFADHYAFALFLPGAKLTLHASLHPADGSERQMLLEALDKLDAGRDLLVLDRGYVGNTVVASLGQQGLGFCLCADTRG